VALLGLAACYTLQPVPADAVPRLIGWPIALDITDAGRVAMGGSMGPEIRQIEGRLIRNDGEELEIAVSGVHYLRGGEQGWSGERVRVRKEHVAGVHERQLSKGRTVVASATGALLVGVLATQVLEGSILGDRGQDLPDSSQSRRRPARP
jgi:hypothetical protein